MPLLWYTAYVCTSGKITNDSVVKNLRDKQKRFELKTDRSRTRLKRFPPSLSPRCPQGFPLVLYLLAAEPV